MIFYFTGIAIYNLTKSVKYGIITSTYKKGDFMNRLYVKLKKRFITERIDSNVYNLYFFREYMMKFTDEEVYQILQYSSQKFHDYVNFIKKLSINNKYDNNKIKEISKIIFNSQNGDIKSLKRIVLHTNILNNPDVIEFAHAFIMKDDVTKTNYLCFLYKK